MLTLYLGNVSKKLLSLFENSGFLPAGVQVVVLESPEDWKRLEPSSTSLLLLQIQKHSDALAFPNGLEYLWALRARGVQLPWVLLKEERSDFADSFTGLAGAEESFLLPQDRGQLTFFLEMLLEPEHSFPTGRELNLFDYLTMGHYLKLNARFRVSSFSLSGVIDLWDGELLSAVTEEKIGEDALSDMLLLSSAQIELEALEEKPPQPLTQPFQELLLQASYAQLRRDVVRKSASSLNKENIEMADLNTICQEIVEEVSDSVACAVVDLNSGMLMGVYHTVPYFTQSYLDAVAASAVDMFRGKNIRRVEQLLSKHRGREVKDSFQEIFINSVKVFHFMKIISEKDAVVVLVTKKTTNQGMGWRGLRGAVDDITAAI